MFQTLPHLLNLLNLKNSPRSQTSCRNQKQRHLDQYESAKLRENKNLRIDVAGEGREDQGEEKEGQRLAIGRL